MSGTPWNKGRKLGLNPAHAERMRGRVPHNRLPREVRQCIGCDVSFEVTVGGTTPQRVYCSRQCFQTNGKAQWRAKVEAATKSKTLQCKHCDKSYTPRSTGAKYCSLECQKQVHVERKQILKLGRVAIVCDLCGRANTIKGHRISTFIDHCHISGKTRGALCVNCNTALGLAGDDPELVDVWASYLRKHTPVTQDQLQLFL